MAHFSFTSLFQIGLFLILFYWTKESTGASFSLEDEFKQLKENYIKMNEIVKNLESEVTELKSEISELKAKDVQMQNKVNELELRDVEMREKVTELEAKDVEMRDKVAQQDSLLFDLLREKNERTAAAANQSAVAINGLPSSCSDLKMIGHTLNGFYSVAGSAMIEFIYCDFNKLPGDPNFQKWIGYADVKSAPVHFYVQRNSTFSTEDTPIPFELARVNEGNAMNLTSGIFTAPRPGIYFFSFTGLVKYPESSSTVGLGVFLYLNGDQIGTGYARDANTVAGQWSPLPVQWTLNLKKGDQVWLQIWDQVTGTYLWDDSHHHNHFTGFMLEEEILASL